MVQVLLTKINISPPFIVRLDTEAVLLFILNGKDIFSIQS